MKVFSSLFLSRVQSADLAVHLGVSVLSRRSMCAPLEAECSQKRTTPDRGGMFLGQGRPVAVFHCQNLQTSSQLCWVSPVLHLTQGMEVKPTLDKIERIYKHASHHPLQIPFLCFGNKTAYMWNPSSLRFVLFMSPYKTVSFIYLFNLAKKKKTSFFFRPLWEVYPLALSKAISNCVIYLCSMCYFFKLQREKLYLL